MQTKIIWLCFSLLLAFSSPSTSAETIEGRVIGISDGDTITVLRDNTQYKIRLYGIDCPESHQDFGARAKQFVSGLVFGENVRVVREDIDRYGRVVGLVYLGDTCINESIIKNGFAWVYDKYCREPRCMEWKNIESMAKISKTGLWSQQSPIPPWEFRKNKKVHK